jgi:hypothetical protein
MIENNSNVRAVVYHYYENDDLDRDNLLWLLTLGWRSDIDFYIGLTNVEVNDFPKLDNIFYFHRENHNYDYGGHADIVNKHLDWRRYQKIIFINSKVRGPIVPCYVDHWFDSFTKFLNDDIGIVGATINILNDHGGEGYLYRNFYQKNPPFSHVQTTIFALDFRSMDILDRHNFWNNDNIYCKMDTIIHFEIRLSQILIEHGLNLKCMLSPYNTLDYRNSIQDINKSSANGDPRYKNHYFGRTIDPYQIMFLTTNREIYDIDYVEHLCMEQLDQVADHQLLNQEYIKKWLVGKYLKNKKILG